ncbi:DNA repair exonuclease [Leptothermofonsia sichuanensis E412]|jgi:DNA repair exonuclease SbcCD nuclease subunit|uniref:metallophosphoesterase family protein n=1 Tax=Leptothermofonsia sichuanensis TaxID=2917832 RepID=UPI001CA76674|nr:DNA repair exonuclease [Leptothermofonsia sichuanensis]QZZ20797.1 DNA repair exonuclease [Leptothermofonsia sichuanensis E412]
MPRFLHLADIHLGFDRYDSKERSLDFYHAFRDVLERFAIAPQVDFVLIAGDLFEHRSIQPNVLNQAQLCLRELKQAGIPVLAIEGNHDNRPYGTKTSWLRYLSDWELLILLEPDNGATGEVIYEPWNPETKQGGYIDLDCGVRVLGSYWYGASAPRAIAALADAIQQLPAGPPHSVMMFHHGLEGQIARYQGALRYTDLLPLKDVGIDYLALGHIHKNYAVEGWIFNPGSLEANSIEESQFERGAYLVDLEPSGIQATLKRDYYQRAIARLQVTTQGQESAEALEELAITTVQQAIQSGKIDPDQAPIVELRIEGQVGFDRLELDIRKLQQQLKQISGALIFLLKYNVDAVAYASPIAEEASRLQVEQEVFTDLLAANNTYKKRAVELAQGLIDLKDRQLQGESEETLYQVVQNLLMAEPAG